MKMISAYSIMTQTLNPTQQDTFNDFIVLLLYFFQHLQKNHFLLVLLFMNKMNFSLSVAAKKMTLLYTI